MRKQTIFYITLALIAINAAYAGPCDTAPSATATQAEKDTWCNTTCKDVFTNTVCAACQATKPYATKDAKRCTATNCATAITTWTTAWCTDCDATKFYASTDAKSCALVNCSATPASGSYTDDWCTTCKSTTPKANTAKSACQTAATSSLSRIYAYASLIIILIASI